MRTKARLHDIAIDFSTKKVKATFLLSDVSASDLEPMMDKSLVLDAKVLKPKKTNDQNGYMWILLQALADYIKDGSGRWEQYLRCIKEYGVFCYLPAREEDIPMLKSAFRLIIDRGEVEITTQSGKEVKVHQLQCFKGTSQYNKEEMSNFLDKIIAECKDCGIDTLTPEEMAHMKGLAR